MAPVPRGPRYFPELQVPTAFGKERDGGTGAGTAGYRAP